MNSIGDIVMKHESKEMLTVKQARHILCLHSKIYGTCNPKSKGNIHDWHSINSSTLLRELIFGKEKCSSNCPNLYCRAGQSLKTFLNYESTCQRL